MKLELERGVTLYRGDCLEVMPTLEVGSIDMVMTDPPYGMDYQSSRRIDKFEKIHSDSNLEWLEKSIYDVKKVIKDGGSLYCFCSWHKIDLFKQEIEKMFKVKNIIVWNKNNHGSGDLAGSYSPKHEFVIFAHNGRHKLRGPRFPDVINFSRVFGGDMKHPTQKPIGLVEIFIKKSTDVDDLIIDPFMGSGTTGVAAVNLNRKFIGIEMDEGYFEIARKRIQEAIDKKEGSLEGLGI